jgi:hypothetical protein
MKKLALITFGIILTLSSFAQSPHDVTAEYVINGNDTVQVEKTIDFVSLKFNGKGKVTINLENYKTGFKQKLKMEVVSCDTDHYLSHQAVFYLYHEEVGNVILVKNDDTYVYKLYADEDGLGNFHKLFIM